MTHYDAVSKRHLVAVAMFWAVVSTIIAGSINARGEQSIGILGDECAYSKGLNDCFSKTGLGGGGGGFTMGAPSGNEQFEVIMGPSSRSQVIIPGRDASVTEYITSDPSGTVNTHNFIFHEGKPDSIDDETITVLSEDSD